jgi:hypothetical protein
MSEIKTDVASVAAKNVYELAVEALAIAEVPAIDTVKTAAIQAYKTFALPEVKNAKIAVDAATDADPFEELPATKTLSAKFNLLKSLSMFLTGDATERDGKNGKELLHEVLKQRAEMFELVSGKTAFEKLTDSQKALAKDAEGLAKLRADFAAQPKDVQTAKIAAIKPMREYAELLNKIDAIKLQNANLESIKTLHQPHVKNDIALKIFTEFAKSDLAVMESVIKTFGKVHKTTSGDGKERTKPASYQYTISGKIYSGKHTAILSEILKDNKIAKFDISDMQWDGVSALTLTTGKTKSADAKHDIVKKYVKLPNLVAVFSDGTKDEAYAKGNI